MHVFYYSYEFLYFFSFYSDSGKKEMKKKINYNKKA